MRAIGFPTFRYRLACFVIAGAMCGLAGALLANHTDFISPAMMHWTRSGDLIVMVVLGGMGIAVRPGDRRGRAAGARGGAVAAISAGRMFGERVRGEYWQIVLGPLLLLVVLYRARRHRRPAREARAVADAAARRSRA